MIVYKFGGASVRSAKGIRNIAKIVSTVTEPLFVVVSAMGKMTNALEVVHSFFIEGKKEEAKAQIEQIKKYHYDICDELFDNTTLIFNKLNAIFDELENFIKYGTSNEFDQWYDKIVPFGEIASTTIVSEFLNNQNVANKWLDMRELLVTDSRFREANVLLKESKDRFQKAVDFSASQIYVAQGFIGANEEGDSTTLGREGSDYSAAIVGSLLKADSVSIWKDVEGVLNADPREFQNTTLIPELTYQDAVELAFSGAQVIHPKTIKPLKNENIPLFVRPFETPEKQGSIIHSEVKEPISVPIFILKKNVVLITVRPMDLSFVLEESLSKLFILLEKHRLKVSLIQSSAVSISICVDNSRYLSGALQELSNDFKVSYNENLELLTIRGRTDKAIEETTKGREILLKQLTRRNARFLLRK